MKNGQIWTIVIVSLVVAVIVSLVTVSITGNVIKQNNRLWGKYEVYTKQEVDAMTKCYKFDFNCDSSVNTGDAVVIGDLWKSGFVITASSVTSQKCQNLGVYLGELWKSGQTEIPAADATAIGSKIKTTCSAPYHPILP